MPSIDATDKIVTDFLAAWHENQVVCDGPRFSVGFFDGPMHEKKAKQKSKWIYLDQGGSGHFMMERATGKVYSIKGYGTPNLKKYRGHISFLTDFIKNETEHSREYMHKYWYDLHPTE